MAFIETSGIVRRFPGVVALNGVSLAIELGQVHVLAGENGAGKSTLVKILTGTYRPSEGSLRIDGGDPLAHPELFDYVAYVPQELSLFEHMTVAENLFMPFGKSGTGGLRIDYAALNRAATEYIERFEIGARPGQRVKDIPVADRQLVQIARASTQRRFKAIILDEPTSSLTAKETERLFGIVRQLRDTNHAVVFISHKMDEIFALGDVVTVLRNGENVGTRAMRDLDARELIRMMSGEEIAIDRQFQPQAAPGEEILRVRDLCGPRFHDVSFALRRGEILGFAGLVGAGRSEVMQTIFGFLPARGGTVEVEGKPWPLGDTSRSTRNGVLYLSEERRMHGIFPLLGVRENVGIALLDRLCGAPGVISREKETRAAREVIDTYAVKTASLDQAIMFLSGGNQQKVIIGRAMLRRPRLLIFDEPTKGIDVRTKAEIYRLMKQLAEQGVGIILVSSDMEELRKCASRIVTMYRGTVNGEYVTAATTNQQLVAAILGAREEHPDHA
ncbi:sugar ABC transporter ATP-binding protein [Propionivibrio sp.]|uniref:sugar ABC transporter ATP-binding protein n=1 Tax=Propionivibrio sp. TaxID=2212460 RepID=UPI0039E256F0